MGGLIGPSGLTTRVMHSKHFGAVLPQRRHGCAADHLASRSNARAAHEKTAWLNRTRRIEREVSDGAIASRRGEEYKYLRAVAVREGLGRTTTVLLGREKYRNLRCGSSSAVKS